MADGRRTHYSLTGAARRARQLGYRCSRHVVTGAILRGELRASRAAEHIWLVDERDLTKWLRGRATSLEADVASA